MTVYRVAKRVYLADGSMRAVVSDLALAGEFRPAGLRSGGQLPAATDGATMDYPKETDTPSMYTEDTEWRLDTVMHLTALLFEHPEITKNDLLKAVVGRCMDELQIAMMDLAHPGESGQVAGSSG